MDAELRISMRTPFRPAMTVYHPTRDYVHTDYVNHNHIMLQKQSTRFSLCTSNEMLRQDPDGLSKGPCKPKGMI
jgi:hypothetical protein